MVKYNAWGISAVGSASHWQCGGQEFKSPMLHKQKRHHWVSFLFMKCDEISQFIVKRDAGIRDLRKQESSETVITENGKVNLLGIHRQL